MAEATEDPQTLGEQIKLVKSCLTDMLGILESQTTKTNTMTKKMKEAARKFQKYEHFLELLRRSITPVYLDEPSPFPMENYEMHKDGNLELPEGIDKALRKNLIYLVNLTRNWEELKVHLFGKKLLTRSDIQQIDKIPDDLNKYYEMYMRVLRQPDWPARLIPCMENTGNEDAAELISDGLKALIKKRMNLLESYLNCKEGVIRDILDNSSNVQNCQTMIKTTRATTKIIKGQVKSAESRENELHFELQKYESALQEAVRKVLEITAKVKHFRGENKLLCDELEKVTEIRDKLQQQKKNLEEELENCKETIKQGNSQLQMLQERLEANKEKLDNLFVVKQDLQLRLTKINLDYATEKAKSEAYINLLHQTSMEDIDKIRNMEKKITTLENEKAQLMSKLLTTDDILEQDYFNLEMERKLEELNARIQHLRNCIESYSESAVIQFQGIGELQVTRWDLYWEELVGERFREIQQWLRPNYVKAAARGYDALVLQINGMGNMVHVEGYEYELSHWIVLPQRRNTKLYKELASIKPIERLPGFKEIIEANLKRQFAGMEKLKPKKKWNTTKPLYSPRGPIDKNYWGEEVTTESRSIRFQKSFIKIRNPRYRGKRVCGCDPKEFPLPCLKHASIWRILGKRLIAGQLAEIGAT